MGPPARIDSAIASLLHLDPSQASISGAVGGGTSSASTSKITAQLPDGSTKSFFVKTGSGPDAEVMFAGEYASLNALHDAVPNICPKAYGHGKLADSSGKSFFVTDFFDRSGGRGRSSISGVESLAQKLARLHTTPAPIPEGFSRPQFGFPVVTCCGDTPQRNDFRSSWADFYANNRLRHICDRSRKTNGTDAELNGLVERTCEEVVPRLLADDHLNDGHGVTPVVVHGDLWSGNASSGKLPGMDKAEEVIFDSSACYAHSEFELGIMKMFGGFGGSFLREYHQHVPKTQPEDEYEDRVALYELYHHLNHHAMFGGGYRSGAVSIMRNLLRKYGNKGKAEI